MLLLLIRHAQAADPDPGRYPDDTLRPLVPRGKKIQRRMSRELKRRKLVPARVLSSPWKRAWQTARILRDELGLPRKARVACPALAGPPDPAALAALAALAATDAPVGGGGPETTLALVGHEPWMSELAALLLTGRRAGLRIDFPKSGIMGIAVETIAAGGGELRFFARP
jgi:phosphohistidine phosphatase